MEEVRICDYCGRVLAEGEGTPVDDELLCDDCVEEHCVTCDHCGETIWEQNSVSDEDTCLCQNCFDAHYYRCESCGQIVPESLVCWHSDLSYCERCFDEFEDEIEEYGYKPTPIFYGNGKRYFGVELEVDEGGKDNDNAASLKDIANVHEENIYIKSDGSLEDGFEIVSHPMTLEYHTEEMNWKEILREAVSMGYRSHQTSTCGLHIHVNRNAFGDNQTEQEDVISRILFFVEKHWNELFTFSRRSSYNMSRWSARFGFEKTGKQILEKAKSGCNGRYVAVNPNKRMAELVEGSFVFTILKNDNTLFLVKGNNPLTVYHFPALGLYVYASTKSILDNALKKVNLNGKCCEVDVSEGEILEINSAGNLSRSTFTIQDYIHTMFNPYNWDQLDYAKWWMEDEREELLLEYCGTFGVSEEEVKLLLEVGYDPDEIEELLMDTAAMEESISEAKTLLQCEA